MQVQKYNQGDQLSQQLQLHGGKSGGTALVLASLAGTGRVGDLLRGSFLFSSLLSSLLSSLFSLPSTVCFSSVLPPAEVDFTKLLSPAH